jgi:hexosaminidase
LKLSPRYYQSEAVDAIFDYYQSESKEEPLAIGGYLPIEKVYSLRLEDKLGYKFFIKNKDKILGIQANLWTEYLNTEENVNYMLFPRFYALVEVVNRRNDDFLEFSKSLKKKN